MMGPAKRARRCFFVVKRSSVNLSGGRLHHIAALLCALAASRCAILAVLRLVFSALVRASFADIGAQLADLHCVLAGPAHELGGQAANCCAFIVQFNAAGHHLRIWLLKAGCGAGVACLGTMVASLDTRLELILIHGLSP